MCLENITLGLSMEHEILLNYYVLLFYDLLVCRFKRKGIEYQDKDFLSFKPLFVKIKFPDNSFTIQQLPISVTHHALFSVV